MPWPQPTDYNDAVQNPGECFTDPELKEGVVASDPFGLPMPFAGNFANVYQVRCPNGQTWAVKCFTREVPDLQQRYSAISSHLASANRAFHVEFRYLAEGILVRGQPFPVLKMRWVEGLTLNQFLLEHVSNSNAVQQMGRLWVRLAGELREAKMAHGDLQHSNVLLVPGGKAGSLALKLIDYDGMWVPALDREPAGERGHPNYQHPTRLREGDWSMELDRFSHLVIYTALRSLLVGGRTLWDRHDNSENLLFRARDLAEPARSPLFRELWANPEPAVWNMVGHLVLAALGPVEQVPFLGDIVDGAGEVLPLSAGQRARVQGLLGPGGRIRLSGAPRYRPAEEVPTILPLADEKSDSEESEENTRARPARTARPRKRRARKRRVPGWAFFAVGLGVSLLLVLLGLASRRISWKGASELLARPSPSGEKSEVVPVQPRKEPEAALAPILEVAREAVRTRELTLSPRLGGGARDFDDLPPDGGLVVGLEVGLGDWRGQAVIHSIRPIYLTPSGRKLGALHGQGTGRVVVLEAAPGYALGDVTIKAGAGVDGLSATFMAIEGRKLNPARAYSTAWVGGQGGGRPTSAGGTGAPIVGLYGRLHPTDNALNGLGLVSAGGEGPGEP